MTDFEVIFADIGQGDCTLIRLPNGEHMLVDVYRCPGDGIDLFKLLDAVLPDDDDGRKRLDYLVITHAHDDHITGIGDLYDRYSVNWLWLPQHEDRKQIAKHFGEYQRVAEAHPDGKVYRPQGSRAPLDIDLGADVNVRCFSPPGYIEIDETLSEEEAKSLVHENCLVMRLSFKGVSIMLTGDSDVVCWKRVVGYYAGRGDQETGTEVLDSTILHASHHGSRTFIKANGEDSDEWRDGLQLINPEAVVVSVGKDNRHGHPHEDMMDAYRKQAGADNVHETSKSGTVVLTVDSTGSWELTLDREDGEYASNYGWSEDDDDDDGGPEPDGRGGGAPGVIVPPPPARPPRKPQPERGRRYG